MNSLWTVAFFAVSCRCLQKGAAPASPSWSLVWLCAHPSLPGSFTVLVIWTVDFYKIVTFTLLCLYCHNNLRGSQVFLCKFLDNLWVISVKPEHTACSEEDVNGSLDNGSATAPCLQDIPPFFGASSQAPSDTGWIMCQGGPAGGTLGRRSWGLAAGGSLGGDRHTW